MDNQVPRFDIQLLFEEIGVCLDDNQYRDAISLIDMYHVYLRQRQVCFVSLHSEISTLTFMLQYGQYRPSNAVFSANPARGRLLFATNAILEGVRLKNRQWTWKYFAERRDDRNAYVGLFQRKLLGTLAGNVSFEFIYS